MEKNYSSTDHSAVSDPALSLPQFDEDATLLAARPVVPLHAVKAETRSKRVIFGLTILAAILVGAISATLLLLQSGQNSQTAADSEVSQPIVSASGAAGGFTSESAEARVPVLPEPEEEPQPREVLSTRDSSIKKRPSAVILRSSEKSARASRDRERDEDSESDERELRRAERRDERREARRERRHRQEQRGDDLLRIREIFEGARP